MPTTSSTPSTFDAPWIVAHDFSASADAAAALALADAIAAKQRHIVLVHVVTVMSPPASIEGVPFTATHIELERIALQEAARALERVAERLRAAQTQEGAWRVEIEAVVRAGTPAEAILEESAARSASRIVVGTHGRAGVVHWLLGSVAERVVRRAKVPVLVGHAPSPSLFRAVEAA